MPDYGEPWKVEGDNDIVDRNGKTVIMGMKWEDCFDGDGESCDEGVLQRIVECVNEAAEEEGYCFMDDPREMPE